MATKQVEIPGIGIVTLSKRRGNRNIRLGFSRDGSVRVSLPYYVPFQAGISFAVSKTAWITKHRPEQRAIIEDGDRIGKAHRVIFEKSPSATRPTTRVGITYIKIILPPGMDAHAEPAQAAAERGAHKALKQQAELLLPQRLIQLAKAHNFTYRSLQVKRLSSRWGSCSQHKDIILNIYLMQLPWELIDYVIIHELVHTEHLNHSAAFWERFEEAMPDAKQRRKAVKAHRATLMPSKLQPKHD